MQIRNVTIFSAFLSYYAFATDLFEYRGKKYTENDLTPSVKQNLYEADQLRFENYQQIVDFSLLDLYFNEEALKAKKTREEIEKTLLVEKNVSDAEAKTWFDQNQARLGGRTFDSLKGEIIHLIQRQDQDRAKELLLVKIKTDGKFNFLLQGPVAPVMDLKIDGFPTKGNLQAKVTIVEFADYQCPHCKIANEVLGQLVEKYKDKVKFVYLDFPINHSGISKLVAEAAVCANDQGKYWQFHDLAFKNQDKLNSDSPEKLAKELGLDLDKFKTCLKTPKPSQVVEKGKNEGQRVGVQGTPAIYINGRKHPGYSVDTIIAAIEKESK